MTQQKKYQQALLLAGKLADAVCPLLYKPQCLADIPVLAARAKTALDEYNSYIFKWTEELHKEGK